jgi:LmbE family N-acetylglucosaminyl deacetylase
MSHPFPFGTVLGVWAHPDDEAYLSAGFMATAADAGARVVVATATRGEGGGEDAGAAERLAALRERELAESLQAIGVREHRWLQGARPLVDGGLARVPHEEGVGLVADLLADVRPDVVLTFGPDGLTGHADHRAVSAWVTAAWRRAGAGPRLWYAAVTRDFLERWGKLSAALGVWMTGPPEPVDRRAAVHVQDFTGAVLERKIAALRAHRSQTAGLIDRVGAARYRQWWRTEAFVEVAATSTTEREEAA